MAITKHFSYINEIIITLNSMEKISKKDVRIAVTNLIEATLSAVKLSKLSGKAEKSLIKLSRKFATLLHDEIKKQIKAETKALKAIDEKELLKKVKKEKTKKKPIVMN
jgi:hypothetical protein